MTLNADQVAREVLTEMAQRFREDPLRTLGETGAQLVEAHRDEHYPAPAAPVTVEVGGVKWTRDEGAWNNTQTWYSRLHLASTFLDRIASDARRIEALERERGAARRALEAAQSAGNAPSSHQTPMTAALGRLAATGASAVPPRCGNPTGATVAQECRDMATATSQGEGLGKITEAEQVAAEEPGDSRVTVEAAPAPIPLGAKMRIGDTEWTRVERGWDDGMAWYSAIFHVGQLATAHYRALHPVADTATVERVALRVKQYNGPTAVSAEGFARIILEELGYTIQEGEA